jgi:hypothetical protein
VASFFGFSLLTDADFARFESIVSKYATQIKDQIVTSAQGVVDAVTAELSNLAPTLTTLLTEVNALVAAQQGNPSVNTDALKAAADAVAQQVNAVAAAAEAPPVVTPDPGTGGDPIPGSTPTP